MLKKERVLDGNCSSKTTMFDGSKDLRLLVNRRTTVRASCTLGFPYWYFPFTTERSTSNIPALRIPNPISTNQQIFTSGWAHGTGVQMPSAISPSLNSRLSRHLLLLMSPSLFHYISTPSPHCRYVIKAEMPRKTPTHTFKSHFSFWCNHRQIMQSFKYN